jgi:hypothetical protein
MNEYADKKVKLQTRSAERSTEHKKRIPARRETVEAER